MRALQQDTGGQGRNKRVTLRSAAGDAFVGNGASRRARRLSVDRSPFETSSDDQEVAVADDQEVAALSSG
jgi:hypothetical protein